MRLSELFTKTRKSVPADELALNAQLLIKAGFIHKEMAGVYSYLPLGLRVLENIKSIVRAEMNSLGAQEIIMSSLQRKELWEQTNRWSNDVVDIWFKSRMQNGNEVGFGWSHEEPITEMMKEFLTSYRDLPKVVYQFQTKMRNEIRSKSGIMRTREFLMKDLYSFSTTEEAHQLFYNAVSEVYLKIYKQVGLGSFTFLTFASGGAFTQFSHEFQTVTESGEDTIYLDREKKIAVNQEVYTDEVLKSLKLNKSSLEKVKAAEVGNIFSFGSHKAEQLGLYYTDEAGETKPVITGSYGIGVTRLMGVVAEHFADEKGLVWPLNLAPAKVIICRLGDTASIVKKADHLYKYLTELGIEVIYDDRDLRAGEKFADADLIGIPYRVVISQQNASSKQFELKKRTSSESQLVSITELVETVNK